MTPDAELIEVESRLRNDFRSETDFNVLKTNSFAKYRYIVDLGSSHKKIVIEFTLDICPKELTI